MNHHKQIACAVTLNQEQFTMLLTTQQALVTDISKKLQSQQETNTELGKAATAFCTWLENNPTLPSSSNMSNLTSAISGLFQQPTPQLEQITKAIKATVQEPTKVTYFKDYGIPTLGTILSITTLVLGLVLSQSIDNSNTNNITIDTHDDPMTPGNSTAPDASSSGYGIGDTTSLFTGLAAGLVLGVIIGAGSYRCFAESAQRESDYGRQRVDSDYEDGIELAVQPEESAYDTRQDSLNVGGNDDAV